MASSKLSSKYLLFGVVLPPIYILMILVAVWASPWFSWQTNALSDIGVSAMAPLFNTTLWFIGITILLMAFLFRYFFGMGITPMLLFLIAGLGTIGIGVFTEHYGWVHLAFSMVPFTLLPLAAIKWGYDVRRKYPDIAIVSFCFGITGWTGLIAYEGIHHIVYGIVGTGAFEFSFVLVASIWIMYISWWGYTHSRKRRAK